MVKAVYKTWETERRDGWVVESNILDVIAGIGLSWLSHIDDKSMSWDRFFLMS